MKKLLTFITLLILALCLYATSTEAVGITSNDDDTHTRALGLQFTLIDNGTAYEVARGMATASEIVVPDTYNFLPVTRIADNGFNGFSALTSITLTEGVTSIGQSAFSSCSSLTSITIPEGVTSIGQSAFSGCSSLESLTVDIKNNYFRSENNCIIRRASNSLVLGCKNSIIPNSVTSIGASAFYGCSSLTGITIPEGVTSIGNNAFSGCSSLTSITIPEGVTSIGQGAFSGCSSLTSITVPEGVTSIGWSAFSSCSSLTSITIPEGVTSIASYAFLGCSSLTSITVPEGVTSIGEMAFRDCSSLTSITIPEGVTSIGSVAFYGCSSLTSITIPEGVTSIGEWTFYDCSSLTSITIPERVTSIEYNAFSGCSSLTSITIPEGVTSIGENAFYGCSSLTSITIPEGVTSIGSEAFYGCYSLVIFTELASQPAGWDTNWNISNRPVVWGGDSGVLLFTLINNNSAYSVARGTAIDAEIVIHDTYNLLPVISIAYNGFSGFSTLASITIPEGVSSIGQYAFSGCSSLTSITIPEGVTSISYQAFYGCSSLTSITIPEGVTGIGDRAFWGCGSLTSITIPSGVVNIGNSVFSGCSNLTSITIPSGVVNIGNSVFSGCSNLTSITIPSGVTSIGEYAFSRCNSLTSITIPGGVTSIGEYAFSGCSSLAIILLPSEVINIGQGAFSGCSSIESLTVDINNTFFRSENNCIIRRASNSLVLGCKNSIIPNSVTSIEQYAFVACSSLTSITIPEGVTSIGQGAFSGCSSLTSITIPEGVTSIGQGAFYGCSSLTSITIPEGVTSIGQRAFLGCSSLTSITIPEGVTSIASDAFLGCSSLTSITIPESMTSIGEFAFSGCSSLMSITIPEGVTSIGQLAFSRCSSLTSITIPEGVTSIGQSAFLVCSSLTSITVPEGVTSIGDRAFYGCSSLTSITIPEGVTSIGIGAFSACYSLTIFTMLLSQPEGWNTSWNDSNRPIVWGVTTNPIAPNNLVFQIYDDIIHLAWLPPTGVYIPNFISYAIYRNEVVISDVDITNPSFTDIIPSYGYHTYTVSAIYFTGESDLTNTINIAYANATYPFNQDFTENSLPNSWLSNGGWIFGSGYTYSTGNNMLITPLMSITGPNMTLLYSVWGSSSVSTDYEILVSTSGSSEQDFHSLQGNYIMGINHQTRYVDLSAFAGELVQLAFRNSGIDGILFIDDVWVGSLPLTPPSTLQASTPEPLSVALSWEAPEAEWLLGYKVYRKAGVEEAFTLLNQTTDLEFVDTAVTAGIAYEYYVTAVYPSGESIASATAQAVPYNLLPPTNVLATITEGSAITLSWVAPEVIWLTGYKVYRRVDIDDVFALIFETESDTILTYSDINVEAGTTYQYCVTAVYPAGESTQSNIIFVVFYYLMPPTNLMAGATENMTIALSWEAPEAVGLQSYKVYRKAGAEAGFTLLNQMAEVAYEDTTAAVGVEYEYYVTAVYAAGESGQSNVKVAFLKVFNAPTELVANAGNAQVVLSWEAPEPHEHSAVLVGYNIYRGGEILVSGIADTCYTDEGLVNGVEYSYYVVAVYSDPVGVSEATETVSVTPEQPTSNEDDVVVPLATSLTGNYPNPFNPTTTIAYEMASEGNVVIEIYNNKGQKIRSLVNGVRGAGVHKVVWDGRDDIGRGVSSGIYFYRMATSDYVAVKKMVMVK